MEAITLLKIAIRATEGVIELARHDLVLLPPAAMAARGTFEIALKAAWMVDCDDPFDRERRWLQHLRTEERTWKRLANHSQMTGGSGEWALARLASVKDFREKIEGIFPNGYAELPGLPSVPDMVPTLHDERAYIAYIYLSQFMHAERIAASYYAGNDEPGMDAAKSLDWSMPLKVCWLSMFRGGRKIIERLDGNPNAFMSEGDEIEVRKALAVIK